MIIEELNNLFEFVFNNDRTFVLGDLGRLPHVVVEYLSSKKALLKVLVVSPFYTVPVPNDRLIRQVGLSEAAREKCDLLILAEPTAYSTVGETFRNAARVAILSSHVSLRLILPDLVHVVYFHGETLESRIRKVRRLAALQDGSEENGDIRMVRNHIDHPSIVTVGPTKECDVVVVPGKSVPLRGPSAASGVNRHFVVVDLTLVRSAPSAFLYFWDAYDYMADNSDSIDRWSVCFAENGRRPYDRFVQDCIDRLFCFRAFEPWLKELLPMLPFYKSGTVDRRFDVPSRNFVRHRYVAPDSLRDAFKAALVHDLKPLVGGVFSVVR